jgi:hypothetical protein
MSEKCLQTVTCVSRPKSTSFSSEFGFSGRGAAEASKQAKTNLFCIYFYQTDKFINTYFFTVFVISLPTKREIYYLQYNYVLYSDRTIIGFIGFVANLLSRPKGGATVSVRKSASEKELLFVRL